MSSSAPTELSVCSICGTSNATFGSSSSGNDKVLVKDSFWQTNSELVFLLLEHHLQGNYSTALYGAPGRVPLQNLNLVWLQLVSEKALLDIAATGGICLLHSHFMFPIFYSPHNPKFDPVGAMWIRRNYGKSFSPPISNHSWVEVTHCGASSGHHASEMLDR